MFAFIACKSGFHAKIRCVPLVELACLLVLDINSEQMMGVYKPSKTKNKQSIPPVDANAIKAAALVSVIEKHVHEKPLLTVPGCMRLAGISTNLTNNTSLQMRVRRLARRLDVFNILDAIDNTLLQMHGIRPIPPTSQAEAFYQSALKAAVLIHLIDISARERPILSLYECLIHAGLSPTVAEDSTGQQLVRRLVNLLSFEYILIRIDDGSQR